MEDIKDRVYLMLGDSLKHSATEYLDFDEKNTGALSKVLDIFDEANDLIYYYIVFNNKNRYENIFRKYIKHPHSYFLRDRSVIIDDIFDNFVCGVTCNKSGLILSINIYDNLIEGFAKNNAGGTEFIQDRSLNAFLIDKIKNYNGRL